MGLKFCPTRLKPTNNINKTLKRFNRDIRRMAYLYYNPPKKKPGIRCIPELYISQKWNAPERYPHVEKFLEDFERHYQKTLPQPPEKLSLTNLNPRQWAAAKALRESDNVIAIKNDKNMGAATLPRPVYNTAVIDEHMGDEAVYLRLPKVEAVLREKLLHAKVMRFTTKWKNHISPAEFAFLDAACNEAKGRTFKSRMTPKVHKKSWKMQPIVCCCEPLLN